MAVRETGLSEVMLRRYLLTLERLEAIEREAGLPPGDLHAGGFAPTELALRLHSRAPDKGIEALQELKDRKITLRDVRRRLENAEGPEGPAPRQIAIKDRGILVARCEGLVAGAAGELFGAGVATTRRPSAKYLRRVGFEFHDAEGAMLGGADLYLAESGGRDPLDALAQSVILASRLPVFHVILGPDLGEAEAERASEALEVLAVPSVGVLLLRDDSPARLIRPAQPRTPDPEDAARYAEILKRFATGRSPLRD
jgi:hypothetical protein